MGAAAGGLKQTETLVPTMRLPLLPRSKITGLLSRGMAQAASQGSHVTAVRFRNTMSPHPLGMEKTWENPTLHHVWKPEELEERLNSQPRHSPEFISEKVLRFTIRGLYKGFNFISGYNGADPDPDAVAFRLLLLESVAGVPPFVAASHRHFRSLRAMERDNGWIHTLLQEAENERMHLLTFMKVFTPSFFTRSLVFGAQGVFFNAFFLSYLISPR